MKRTITAIFREHVVVLHVSVFFQSDGNMAACVRVQSHQVILTIISNRCAFSWKIFVKKNSEKKFNKTILKKNFRKFSVNMLSFCTFPSFSDRMEIWPPRLCSGAITPSNINNYFESLRVFIKKFCEKKLGKKI
jgi:hypothetical protein